MGGGFLKLHTDDANVVVAWFDEGAPIGKLNYMCVYVVCVGVRYMRVTDVRVGVSFAYQSTGLAWSAVGPQSGSSSPPHIWSSSRLLTWVHCSCAV